MFLAQHYGVPTRLLDWTEGALSALYFAINGGERNFRVYMLNPRRLNDEAGVGGKDLNYPLTFEKDSAPELYIENAWQNRKPLEQLRKDLKPRLSKLIENQFPHEEAASRIEYYMKRALKIPIAFPATYQDMRMIGQRSCFTIHGYDSKSIIAILEDIDIDVNKCLIEYNIDIYDRRKEVKERNRSAMLKTLSILGISAASLFPDLDHLAKDLVFDVDTSEILPK